MEHFAEYTCETHPDRHDCGDCLIDQDSNGCYGIMIHDGGSSMVRINFCPWCGAKLPEPLAYDDDDDDDFEELPTHE
nr:hypothetical protein [Novosphingobium naphthalenivorans]